MSKIRYAALAAAASAPGFLLPFALARQLAPHVADDFFLLLSISLLVTTVAVVVGESHGAKMAVGWHGAKRVPRVTLSIPYALVWVLPSVLLWVVLNQMNERVQHGLASASIAALSAIPTIAALGSAAAGTHLAVGLPSLSIGTSAFRGGVGLVGTLFATVFSGDVIAGAVIGMLLGELARALICLGSLGAIATAESQKSHYLRDAVNQLRGVLPHAAAMATVNVNPVISRGYASLAPAGGVVAIELSDKLLFALVTLISSVLLVPATRSWTSVLASPHDQISRLLGSWKSESLRGIVTGALVTSIAGCAIVWPGRMILERMQLFDDRIWICTLILLVGLPANNVIILGARLVALLGKTGVLPGLAITNLVVMWGSAFVLYRFFGVLGVAAASTIMRCCSALLYLALVPRLIRKGSRVQLESVGGQ